MGYRGIVEHNMYVPTDSRWMTISLLVHIGLVHVARVKVVLSGLLVYLLVFS